MIDCVLYGLYCDHKKEEVADYTVVAQIYGLNLLFTENVDLNSILSMFGWCLTLKVPPLFFSSPEHIF